MSPQRDYNEELKDTKDHKYAYNFDFDVMHPFMIKSFQPFFRQGNVLELGSFEGAFTKRLLPYFSDITCVEASENAINIARREVRGNIRFIHSLFENASLSDNYDNIILTHVLEHLDEPVTILKRINDEWLSDTGRFFFGLPECKCTFKTNCC